jgi:hypothetical protein
MIYRFAEDQGEVVLYENIPIKKKSIIHNVPNASIKVKDIPNIVSYTWNYDDDDVELGDSHRTWSAHEVAVATMEEFVNTSITVNNTMSNICYAPTGGVIKIYLNSNDLKDIKIYKEGTLIADRYPYPKANAISVPVAAGDLIQGKVNTGSVDISYTFLPYRHRYNYKYIQLDEDNETYIFRYYYGDNCIINDNISLKLDSWLLGDQGTYLPITDTVVDDVVRKITEYAWKFDDKNILSGSNHLIWSADEMTIASKKKYNEHLQSEEYPHMYNLNDPSVGAGMMRVWTTQPNFTLMRNDYTINDNLIKAYERTLTKYEAHAIKLAAGDVIIAIAHDPIVVDDIYRTIFLPDA